MSNKIYYLGLIAIFFISNAALAGTVIKIQNESDITTVSTDGKFARLDVSAEEYIIIDYKKHTVKVVSPQQRQVMLLDSDQISAGNKAAKVRTSMKNLGAGVTIAGYATQKYAYSANGESCGVIYGSKEVYKKQGMQELFEAMSIMMKKQSALLGGFAGMVDVCTLADMNLAEHVKQVGVPMRTTKNGQVDAEIKSIKYGVTLPANTFVVPASYRVVSMDAQINAVKKNLSNVPQTMPPQMQQMMQQMQQSGQMTPEMMQQMQRAKEMLKQYQQPSGY